MTHVLKTQQEMHKERVCLIEGRYVLLDTQVSLWSSECGEVCVVTVAAVAAAAAAAHFP